MEKVLLIGGAGNVGRGINEALSSSFKTIIIDPLVNNKFEELKDNEIEKLVSETKSIIYTAEDGNRDNYKNNPELSIKNNENFHNFVKKIISNNLSASIFYIGGSWTKRKPDLEWEINDLSPNKSLENCNDYEKAKISAEENAKEISEKYKVKIRFIDYCSVVPNYSPNYTIFQFMQKALENGEIIHQGSNLGRPVLDSETAGAVIKKLIENDNSEEFKKLLMPNSFVSSLELATAVCEVVQQKTGKTINLTENLNAPEFLKTKVHSSLESLADMNNEKIKTALIKTAEAAYFKIINLQK